MYLNYFDLNKNPTMSNPPKTSEKTEFSLFNVVSVVYMVRVGL